MGFCLTEISTRLLATMYSRIADIRREDVAASIAMPKHLDQLDRSEKISNAK